MFFILLAAMLWGCTSPFLKKYSKGFSKADDDADDKKHAKANESALSGAIRDVKFLLSRPKYLITQVLNLSGSVAFFYALRDVDVSVASVVTNSLAFVLTIIVSVFILKEGTFKPRTWLGTLLVLCGVSLCTFGAAVKDVAPAAGVVDPTMAPK